MASFTCQPIPKFAPLPKEIGGVLQAVEDSATTIIWTLEAPQTLVEDFKSATQFLLSFKSAPFTVSKVSLRLLIHSENSQRVFLLVNRADDSTAALKCALYITAGDTTGDVVQETVDFSNHPYQLAFIWDLNEFRLLFGGGKTVRLIVTFFLESSCYDERLVESFHECERHPSTDEDCQGELIQNTCPGITAVWTVDIARDDIRLSEHFFLAEAVFQLRIWTYFSETFVKVVRVKGGTTPFLTSFILTVKTTAKKTLSHRVVPRFDFRANGYYTCKIMHRATLLQLLGDDRRLRIVCSLFQDDDNPGSNSPNIDGRRGLNSLSRDFKELFISGQDSDVSIEVQEEKFNLHKLILSTRCPFFANMLRSDMAEKNTGRVKIPDYTVSDFKDFLQYLYTGEVESFTTEKALALYRAADQYDVPDLKADSLDFMKKNLSVDTLGDVIALSLVHDEKELLERAKQYFTKNVLSVIRTSSWKMFWKENFDEANEMYIKAIVVMAPKSET